MSLRSGDPEEIGGYPVEARLGSGGMGTVFLGRTASGRPVAIKLIHQQFADDDEFRTRFRQEVAAARRVSGAFTAAVVDADPEATHPWMATAYIEGPTLAQRIAQGGPIGGADLRSLAIGLAEALRDIHRADVVHRDLKPSNVVLSPEGPRVIDFGISRAADQQTLTMTGRVIGTPPFMSPEQLQNPRGVGPSSDVFSFATLLVYASTGQGPFDADSPYMTAYQVVHEAPALGDVPPALRVVVEPCLAKDPAARPSVDELLVLLRDLPAELAVVTGGSRTRDTETQVGRDTGATPAPAARAVSPAARGAVQSTSPSATGPAARSARRRWRPVLAAVAAVAVIGAGLAFLSRASDDDTDKDPDGKGRTVAASRQALPDGFRPWRQNVPAGRAKIPDEVRCVTHGDSAYCGGGGMVATRVRVADGKRLWEVDGPGVPVQDTYIAGLAGTGGAGAGSSTGTGTGAGAASGAGAGTGTGDAGPGADKGSHPAAAGNSAKSSAPVVVAYRFAAQGGGGQDEVVALDSARGKELWSAPFSAQSSAVAGPGAPDAVMVGSAVLTTDAAGTAVQAHDARSGRTLWTYPFPAGSQCAPLAAGARAYLMCVPKSQIATGGPQRATVRVVDLDSGEPGRSFSLEGPVVALGAQHGQLVLVRQRVGRLDVVEYEAVLRLDAAHGKVTTSRLGTPYGGTPRLIDGTVYFTQQSGRVSAVAAATGRLKWARHTGVEGTSGPTAGPGALYFASSGGRVAALSPRDGRRQWTSDPQVDGVGSAGTSPRVAFAGRVALVSGSGNLLYAFDTEKPPKSE
ncbi:serine/threonine-protein kinase [Streptomyces silvensis]|uniref:Serine/threonine protein kinase n=1 Tax=Streptomyces silvensis TaxID=1765722 RepID=A0A0W7XBG2_9ACTN|nr:serine/threonine-protein kinase [Streptomyces silvensis]KUF20318.1 serine/threonine protein kinase [Streptomyces silvensis]